MASQQERAECQRLIETAMNNLEVAFPGKFFTIDSEPTSAIVSDPIPEVEEEPEYMDADGSILADEEADEFPNDPHSLLRTSSESSDVPSVSPDEVPEIPSPESPKGGFRSTLASLFRNSNSPSTNKAKVIGPPLLTSFPTEPLKTSSYWLGSTLNWPDDPLLGIATRLAVSHEFGIIAAGLITGQIVVWFANKESQHVKKEPVDFMSSAASVAGSGGVCKKPDLVLRKHREGVTCMQFLPSGDLITGALDYTVVLWRLLATNPAPVSVVTTESVPSCMFLQTVGTTLLVVGSIDGTVRFWSLGMHAPSTPKSTSSGKVTYGEATHLIPLAEHIRYTDPVTCVSISPDNCTLAVGSNCGIVVLYSVQTLRLDAEVDCRNRSGSFSSGTNVVGLEWSKDNQYLCVSSLDSRVRVVHIADLSRRTKFKSYYYTNLNLFNACTLVSKERRLCGLSESGHICSWEVHGSSDTNGSAVFCSLYDQAPLSQAAATVKLETTASFVYRHIPHTLHHFFPLKIPSDHVICIVADTAKRVNLIVELLSSSK